MTEVTADMYSLVDWMKPADETILRLLHEHKPLILTPRTISKATELHSNYVGVRCRKLRDLGLVHQESRGYYKITELGAAVIERIVDPEELESLADGDEDLDPEDLVEKYELED